MESAVPAPVRPVVLEAAGVGVTLGGRPILTGVDLTVRAGEVLFIAGKSGSGKSTLLRVLSGLAYPTAGRVKLFGTDLVEALNDDLLDLHARAGFVFQDSALISNLTLFDNLALPHRYRGEKTEAEIRAMIDTALVDADLEDDRNNRPAALSMGERKIAAILRALLMEPDLLFLDEPLASLDVERVKFAESLFRKAVDRGVTLVVVAHESDFVGRMAKRIVTIQQGRITHDYGAGEVDAAVHGLVEEIG